MSENRFLSFILTEGIILAVLAVALMILPKVTDISFGFVFCLVLIIYGGYKMIISFLSGNFERYYFLNVVSAGILLLTGIIMTVMPVIDMMIVASVIGIYFVLKTISVYSFLCQSENVINFPKTYYLLPSIYLFLGILLIIFMPTLWIVGVFVGLSFLITGIMYINMYVAKKSGV